MFRRVSQVVRTHVTSHQPVFLAEVRAAIRQYRNFSNVINEAPFTHSDLVQYRSFLSIWNANGCRTASLKWLELTWQSIWQHRVKTAISQLWSKHSHSVIPTYNIIPCKYIDGQWMYSRAWNRTGTYLRSNQHARLTKVRETSRKDRNLANMIEA